MYELVLSPQVEELVELGTGHGTSTAYIAAALHTKGTGRADSPARGNTERVQAMTDEERTEHQMHKVLDLLIRTTPGYEVRMLGNLAFAFKGPADSPEFDRLPIAAAALLHELGTNRATAGN